jgi:hypothetical protein
MWSCTGDKNILIRRQAINLACLQVSATNKGLYYRFISMAAQLVSHCHNPMMHIQNTAHLLRFPNLVCQDLHLCLNIFLRLAAL